MRSNGAARPGGRPVRAAFAVCVVLVAACASAPPAAVTAPGTGSIRVTLLQLNDLYEITPSADGHGGPARVATIRRELQATNPNTYTILAGDFLSPSALGTARVDGQRLDGRQMVAVLNAMGLDFATFGNHEFDLSESSLTGRLQESRFRWISSNVGPPAGLPNVARHVIVRVPAGNDTLRLAFTAATMNRDQRPWAPASEPRPALLREAALLRDSADAVVALTHLPIAADIDIVEHTDDIDLVLGGHEHENLLVERGNRPTPIAKADANARSVYVHELTWTPRTRSLSIRSRLIPVTDSIALDPATNRVVEEWVARAYDGFRQTGFEPDQLVTAVDVPLDGLESSILVDTTTLSNLIGQSMLREFPNADAAIYNAGSIRIDDVLPAGPVKQYDVIRILPFGGPIIETEIRGSLLRRTLEQGLANRGTGGFVQRTRIVRNGDQWTVGGQPLDDARMYRVAVTEYLISGREQGMNWLSRENPELRVLGEGRDIRFAFMDELRARFPR